MTYRLYVDEVGNHDLKSCHIPQERYLSLTGAIVDLDYVRTNLHPELEDLKYRYFDSHPDKPVILHRKELVGRLYPFHTLRNRERELAWNEDFLWYLRSWKFHIITVTIDKQAHLGKYSRFSYHPYHYCLEVLLERFCKFLEDHECRGDVLAEARGKKADQHLSDAFSGIYSKGTKFVSADHVQRWLIGDKLQLEEKHGNVSGLQLADLIAHPSFKLSVARHDEQPPLGNFAGKIGNILLEEKYHRDSWGRIDGIGIKWLP